MRTTVLPRQLAGQKLVPDYRTTENVVLGPGGLGGNISGRPTALGLLFPVFCESTGKTKVDDLPVAVLAEADVTRLDVPMDNAVALQDKNTLQDLIDNNACVLRTQVMGKKPRQRTRNGLLTLVPSMSSREKEVMSCPSVNRRIFKAAL
eukprot:scaffold38223_cov153-Amphora_coffeaeformis.AAC.3